MTDLSDPLWSVRVGYPYSLRRLQLDFRPEWMRRLGLRQVVSGAEVLVYPVPRRLEYKRKTGSRLNPYWPDLDRVLTEVKLVLTEKSGNPS